MGIRSYAPILPNKFDIVSTDSSIEPIKYETNKPEVRRLKGRANLILTARRWLYHALTELSLFVVLLSMYLNTKDFDISDSMAYNALMGVVPGGAENLVYFSFFMHSWVGIVLVSLFVFMFSMHRVLRILANRTRKKINWWLFKELEI
jgi:hypothetical protein